MAVDDILLDSEERMDKAIEILKKNLAGIRTGRANPGMVDSLRVEVYGSPVPIKQIASVGTPEPAQILIRPYDVSTIKEIEKAIVASDLGFNPQSDGKLIRINVPALSTDVRKKMVARIKELAEEARVSIRNIRRDGNKAVEQAEKEKLIGEDDRDASKEKIQEMTKRYEDRVNEMARAREADVMDG